MDDGVCTVVMRRGLRRSQRLTWLCMALLLAATATVVRSQPAPATVRMLSQPVAADTWFVQGLSEMGSAANQNFISNAGFVITPAGVLVIDALGSPPLADRLLALIREKTSLPLRYVVVTHCHADHIYGLQSLKAAGARIIAHAGCRDYLASETARLRLQASREELAALGRSCRLSPPGSRLRRRIRWKSLERCGSGPRGAGTWADGRAVAACAGGAW